MELNKETAKQTSIAILKFLAAAAAAALGCYVANTVQRRSSQTSESNVTEISKTRKVA